VALARPAGESGTRLLAPSGHGLSPAPASRPCRVHPAFRRPSPPPCPRPLRERTPAPRTSAAVLGVWTLLGVLESSKAYVADQLQGIHRGWGPALVGNLPWWWCWALLTPVVVRIAARVRLDGPRWPLALAAHVAAASVLSVAYLAAVSVLYWHTITVPVLPYLAPLARQRVATPLGQVEVFLNGYLIVNVMTYGAIVVAWYALRRASRDGTALLKPVS
jgi:hypothetical protein